MTVDTRQLRYPGQALLGQKALVTGAARGIGAAIANALAQAGADVAVNDLVDPVDTVQQCRAHGAQAIPLIADLAERDQVERMVEEAVKSLGRLDIVVSNAAYSDRELFYKANMQGFERTINVCMWAPFYILRAATSHMLERGGGGSMVFISSPHAYKPIPGAMAYNMGKAALDQMAKTAACELAEHRIRVNLVHPGWTNTPGERKFFFEDELMQDGKALPWGRLAEPEDIARGVVFLCDPGSDYMTGSTLTIDGGILLPYQEMFRVHNRPKDA